MDGINQKHMSIIEEHRAQHKLIAEKTALNMETIGCKKAIKVIVWKKANGGGGCLLELRIPEYPSEKAQTLKKQNAL